MPNTTMLELPTSKHGGSLKSMPLSANICRSSVQWALRPCLSHAEMAKPRKPERNRTKWRCLKIFEEFQSQRGYF
jgi:hypothetical protein